jgi:hypothetical protein
VEEEEIVQLVGADPVLGRLHAALSSAGTSSGEILVSRIA